MISARHLPIRGFVSALLLSFISPAVHAGLTWETRREERTAVPGDTEASGIFRFHNSGTSPVTITSIQTSCGCTTAHLEKRSFAPGEAGEIRAVLNLGGRTGLQEKTITVATDEQTRYTLALSITIPELLRYTPRLLYWRTTEKQEWKTAEFSAGTELTIASVELSPPVPSEVVAQWETLTAGRSYRLKLKPVAAGQPINVTVAGTVVFTDGTKVPFSLYALVR
jgi:hypothetical protein